MISVLYTALKQVKIFFFKDFISFFNRERQTERGNTRGDGAEGEEVYPPSRQPDGPDAGLDPWTLELGPEPQADN